MIHSKTSYDHGNAKIFADFASHAYLSESESRKILPDYQTYFIENKITDTQVLIAVDDRHLIISPRGTKGFQDILTDLKFRHHDEFYKQINRELSFHSGVYDAYKSVSADILKVIAKHTDKDIFITGHSLGAGIANLCIVDLHIMQYIPVKALYTYGSLRVFGKKTAKFVNSRIKSRMHRVVRNNDFVVHLPLEIMGYSHTGLLMYLDDDGVMHEGLNLSWWERKQYDLEGVINDIGESGLDGSKDHVLGGYQSDLSFISYQCR